MARLTKLTPEQVEALGSTRERWLGVGLSTEPADRVRAQAAIAKAYAAANLPAPRIWVWLGSPMAGVVGAEYLRLFIEQLAKNGVWAQVGAQVGDQVWAQVRDQVWAQVRAQVGDQVGAQVWDQVRDQVWAQVRAQVGDQVGDQVWAQVGAQVRDQVWAQVRAQVGAQVGDQVGDQVWRAGYGLHDASWLGFYQYFRDHCGLECCLRLDGLIELAECAGWWWPFAGACVITEKPCVLSRDSDGRLHSETGPAVAYPDGWSVWASHGVRVPQVVIEAPETLVPQQIRDERNVEVRRVMIERFGQERYLRESGAALIHEDEWGKLYRAEMPDDEPLVMVEVVNSTPEPDGSFKDYWLRVDPRITTARAAVAWTFDVPTEQYAPLIET